MYHRGRKTVVYFIFKISSRLKDERGSISILTIGLFMVLLSLFLVLTDISSVYLAKRNLTLTTEAAVQRGVKNLDEESYYSGEYNLNRMVLSALGKGQEDPGIPIDCQQGKIDAHNAIHELSRDRGNLFGPQLGEINVEEINCDGYQISLKTSSTATLPFVIPFTRVSVIKIYSHIGSLDERKKTTNYYGINIG